jgi:hypothetical protein
MPGKDAGYLVTKNSYKNFVVRVEFWPSDNANSGIYFRCLDPKKITDRTCYEANIFDQRPDPSYGTGAITRYVEVDPMPKAAGKWNTYEVTAKGRDITVVLNGQTTAKLRNGMFDEGRLPARCQGHQDSQSGDQAFVRDKPGLWRTDGQ